MGCQCITGDHPHTHSLTLSQNLAPTACFWEFGGNQKTQRKPMQTQVEHVKLNTDSNLSSWLTLGPWSFEVAKLPTVPPWWTVPRENQQLNEFNKLILLVFNLLNLTKIVQQKENLAQTETHRQRHRETEGEIVNDRATTTLAQRLSKPVAPVKPCYSKLE